MITAWVKGYVTHRNPDALCNACIADDLGLDLREASQATATLAATKGFIQGFGICSHCGKEREVTSHARSREVTDKGRHFDLVGDSL